MAITQKSIKILWSTAGGRCSYHNCWERLCYPEAKDAAPYTLGEMAHICGDKPGANRHDASQTAKDRDDYMNLILLCPTHHTLIDRKENEVAYTVEILHEMKSVHEEKVLERLERIQKPEKLDVSREILTLLEENHLSWAQFGPTSELARSQPHNEAAHAAWVSERLSIIVPNNRKIAAILTENKSVFDAEEQMINLSFLIHARSYEKWVQDEIPYSAVVRFPQEFDELIRKVAVVGA